MKIVWTLKSFKRSDSRVLDSLISHILQSLWNLDFCSDGVSLNNIFVGHLSTISQRLEMKRLCLVFSVASLWLSVSFMRTSDKSPATSLEI